MKHLGIDGSGTYFRFLLHHLLAIGFFVAGAGILAGQTVEFRESSNPPGLFATKTVQVPQGNTYRVSEYPVIVSGKRFAFWTINGVRWAHPNGQAYLYPSVTVSGPVDAIAHYFPEAEDGDGDRLADWWEYWMFGSRDRGPQDDDDGDGRKHEEEFRTGLSARFVDDVRAGGMSARLSAPLRLIVRNRLRYTLRSEPLGLVAAEGELAPGESYTSPYLIGDNNGFTFIGFEHNGQILRDATGYALHRVSITPTADMTLVARYVPAGSDSDADGIPDAVEWLHFNGLANGPASDPDGDGFPLSEERRLGLSLHTADRVRDGGIAARMSAPLEYDRIRSRYSLQSLPLGLITSSSELVPNGTERTTAHMGTALVSGYAFGYWSLNGERIAGPDGTARRQVKLTVNGASNLVANFFLPDQDADADGLPDWWEWNFLGTLDETPASDPDGDGMTLADERRLGLSVTTRDTLRDGGIASRLSAPLQYESGSRKRLTLRSAPRGIVADSQSYLAVNSTVTSSHYSFTQLHSGYQFTHWTRNGARIKDAAGFSRNQAVFALEEDTELVAHFTIPTEDLDGDTLPDYLEHRLADELGILDATSDPDGDGFSFAVERSQGLSVLAPDVIRDGGIASRLSAPAALQFSVPPLDLMPAQLAAPLGAAAGTLVANLQVSPAIPGRTYQFALELGAGGEDNHRFVIEQNQLKLAATLNATDLNLLRVRIRATDDLGAVRYWTPYVTVAPAGSSDGTRGEWILAGSGNWSNSANWLNGVIPDGAGSAATFARATPGTATLDSARTVGSLQFANANHSIVGTPTLTLWQPDAVPEIEVAAGTRATIGANVGGQYGLTMRGPGELVFAGGWNFTGPTSIVNGALGSQASFASSASLGALHLSGGKLFALGMGLPNLGDFQLRGDVTVAGSSRSEIAADVRVVNGETRNFDVAATGDPSGVDLLISGKIGHHNGTAWGFATKSGAGTMKLSGVNELGSFRVNAGKAILQDAAIGTFANGGLATNAQLELEVGSDNLVALSQAVSGSGSLIKSGSGHLTLSGNSSYSGGTVVRGGKLSITARSADNGGYTSIGTGPVTIESGGTLVSADFWATGNEWNGGNIGKMTINAGGTWTIEAAASTLRNGLEIHGGTINGSASNSDWGGLYLRSTSVTAGANVTSTIAVDTVLNTTTPISVGTSGTLIYSGPIRNRIFTVGALTKNGSGTLVLSAANTYTGATSVDAGTLCVNGSTTSATSVANGAILGGSGTVQGAVTVANGATVAPGSPAQAIGTLTAGSSLKLDGTLAIGLAADSADRLTVLGNLDLTQAKLAVSGTTAARELVIASYGSLAGTKFAAVTGLPAGYRVEIDTAQKRILLVGEASFASWMSGRAGSPADSAPDADPDGDGISNLLEYVLGGDPARADQAIAPRVSTSDGNLVFTFQRADASETPDVSLAVETSTDLVTWSQSLAISPGPPASQVSIQENGNAPDTITVTIPGPASRRYARLRVDLNP